MQLTLCFVVLSRKCRFTSLQEAACDISELWRSQRAIFVCARCWQGSLSQEAPGLAGSPWEEAAALASAWLPARGAGVLFPLLLLSFETQGFSETDGSRSVPRGLSSELGLCGQPRARWRGQFCHVTAPVPAQVPL